MLNMEQVIDMIMQTSLVYLFEGIFVERVETTGKKTSYIRLNEQQTAIEFCKVDDKASFNKSADTPLTDPTSSKLKCFLEANLQVNVVEIADLKEKELEFTIILRSKEHVTFACEDRNELVYFYDGLRCLVGMDMHVSLSFLEV